jgi:tetratricopeptide (TPR) repeat protein
MASRLLAVLPVIVGPLMGCAATQDRNQQWDSCQLYEESGKLRPDTDADLVISACTTLIQSGKETTQGVVRALVNRGTAYRAKGQNDLAIEDYDQAIRIDPNLAIAFNNRGNGYDAKRQYDRAIEDYDQAIRINPNEAFALNNRGGAYSAKGQHDRAIQDYDEALRIDPNYAAAFNNRGMSYDAKDQHDRGDQGV